MLARTLSARMWIFLIVGLLLAAAIVTALNGRGIAFGRRFEVVFGQVDNLRRGAPVMMAGVQIGRVAGLEFEGQKVVVRVVQRSRVEIPDDSVGMIVTAGIIGERTLAIVPGKGKPIHSGARLRGIDPIGTTELLGVTYDLIVAARDLTFSLRGLSSGLDDGSGAGTAGVLGEGARHALNTLARLDRLSQEVERRGVPEAYAALADLRAASQSLSATMSRLERLMIQADPQGQMGRDLRELLALVSETMSSLQDSAALLAGLAGNLDGTLERAGPVLADLEAAAEDLRAFAHELTVTLPGGEGQAVRDSLLELEHLAAWADQARQDLAGIAVQPDVSLAVGNDGTRADLGADMALGSLGRWRVGLTDLGDANDLTLQGIWSPTERTELRLGLYRDAPGVGFDYAWTDNLLLSVDYWQTDSPFVSVGGRWLLSPSLNLGAQYQFGMDDFTWTLLLTGKL